MSPTQTCYNVILIQDDGSGRQVYQLTPVTGGFTVSVPSGRAGCATFLSTAACGGSTALTFVTSATTDLQTFAITPVSSAAGEIYSSASSVVLFVLLLA